MALLVSLVKQKPFLVSLAITITKSGHYCHTKTTLVIAIRPVSKILVWF